MRKLSVVGLTLLAAFACALPGCTIEHKDSSETGGKVTGGSGGKTTGGSGGTGASTTGGASSGGAAAAGGTAAGGASVGGASATGGTTATGGAAAGSGGATATGGAVGSGGSGSLNLVTINHEGGTLTGGAVWAQGIHVLDRSLTVEGGVLEIPACSVIKLPAGAEIAVRNGGALKLIGREDCKITITSTKSGPARGAFNGLWFYDDSDSGKNELDWVVVEYGGGDANGNIWIADAASVSIKNTTVRESKSVGIKMEAGATLRSFTGNSLINNTLGPISLFPNDVGQLGTGTYQPNDVNAINVNGGTVSKDQTWGNLGVPYLIHDDVVVRADTGSAQLTLTAGSTLALDPTVNLVVRKSGGLAAVGTAAAPITFTSSKATPAPGDWGNIALYSDSADASNKFDHVVIAYGGNDKTYGSFWIENGASASIANSTLRDSASYGLFLQDGAEVRDFAGNTLINNALGSVALGANAVALLGTGTYAPNTIPGIIVSEGSTLSKSGTWKYLGVPYVLAEGLNVQGTSSSAAILTVEAGNTLRVAPQQGIVVRAYSGLTLAGTSAAHVSVTSTNANPSPGDWTSISVTNGSVSASNNFTYSDISFGGGDSFGQLWIDDDAEVTLDEVTFTDSESAACEVYLDNDSTSTLNIASGTSPKFCPH